MRNQAENSTITIQNALFKHNYNCRRDFFSLLYSRLPRTLRTSFALNNSIVGAGALTLSIGQSSYRLYTQVDNCNFINNTGLFYNSAMTVLMYNRTKRIDVNITNCLFYRNGGLFYNVQLDFLENGLDAFGALGIAFYVPVPPLSIQPSPSEMHVYVKNSSFIENLALSGTGNLIFIFSTSSGIPENMITIQQCTFKQRWKFW